MVELTQTLIDKYNSIQHDKLIVAVCGNIGVGKSYLVKNIVNFLTEEGYTTAITPIASDLKLLIQYLTSLTKHNLDISKPFIKLDNQMKMIVDKLTMDNEFKENCFKCNDNWRCYAQLVGAYVRDNIDKDFWIQRTIKRIESINTHFIFIPDLRYLNEYKLLKNEFQENLFVVKVIRSKDKILKSLGLTESKYNNMLKHESEQEINFIPSNFIWKNDG